MHLHHVDVKTAFLVGVLDDEVYTEQPPGFHSGPRGTVWKLHKSLYGLKQAPRAWHIALMKVLKDVGFVVSLADPGLFIKRTGFGANIYGQQGAPTNRFPGTQYCTQYFQIPVIYSPCGVYEHRLQQRFSHKLSS
jgi:hypothetical protein